jgi:hypothetical protein
MALNERTHPTRRPNPLCVLHRRPWERCTSLQYLQILKLLEVEAVTLAVALDGALVVAAWAE